MIPTEAYTELFQNILSNPDTSYIPAKDVENSKLSSIYDIISSLKFFGTAKLEKRIKDELSWEEESTKRAQEVILSLYNKHKQSTEYQEYQIDLLERAAAYGLSYDVNDIDYIDLDQTISELEQKERGTRDSLYRDYLDSRL